MMRDTAQMRLRLQVEMQMDRLYHGQVEWQ